MPTTLIVYDSVTPEIAYKFISKLSSSTNPAARLPAGDQSNNENDILLDLRGYVQTDMPALAKRVGLSQHDFATALTATCRELQTFVKIHVDKEHRA